jgi:hypothetical protein
LAKNKERRASETPFIRFDRNHRNVCPSPLGNEKERAESRRRIDEGRREPEPTARNAERRDEIESSRRFILLKAPVLTNGIG